MKKALILIGYQNDYFSNDGILFQVVKESLEKLNILSNTMSLINYAVENDYLVITTPIIFSKDYSELKNPVGILKTIKDVGAFMTGAKGSESIKEFDAYDDYITEVPGKNGLNAFEGTELEQILTDNSINEIILAGCVCSICIDSTGRSASERGIHVTMASDCISSRTIFEHEFYCENVFPIYASVLKNTEIFKS